MLNTKFAIQKSAQEARLQGLCLFSLKGKFLAELSDPNPAPNEAQDLEPSRWMTRKKDWNWNPNIELSIANGIGTGISTDDTF